MSAAGDPLGPVAAALAAGQVVAVPTDTVYGLAADPTRPGATAALFALKGRPRGLSLPVLVADVAQAEAVGVLGPLARRLVGMWPGPLTVVVARRPGLDWDLGDDEGTVGLRQPAHPLMLALLARVGPLATTSANHHGQPPLTDPASVAAAFPDLAVLDGGVCEGLPSTVADATGDRPRRLRDGAMAWSEVEARA